MDEIWKDVYFWENGVLYDYCSLYQVSNHGRVKSLGNDKTGKEKILKGHKNKVGYKCIGLCKNRKRKLFLIHRLVAHMFIVNDNPIEKIEVNHIDENKTNNHVENLEWCDRKYNMNFGTRNERASKKISESLKGKPFSEEHKRKIGEANKGSLVARYDLNMNLIDVKYQFEYVEEFGFYASNISSCCKGKRKSHKGYIFKYYEEVE